MIVYTHNILSKVEGGARTDGRREKREGYEERLGAPPKFVFEISS